MKVLFIGGTGNLSWSCTEAALRLGFEVVHLNRGNKPAPEREGLRSLKADINDEPAVRALLAGGRFDAIVQWIGYKPEDVKRDINLFRDATSQYVFISSASAYQKPPRSFPITESTPLANPYWQYSRDKIACERTLVEAREGEGFPFTIVRPSHTYGDGWIPTAFGSSEFTVAQRMLDGRRIVVPGDGQSLWTLTYAPDFAKGLVGLLGNRDAVGEAFHITSDELLSWDEIHLTIADALGVVPRIVHVPTDFIVSACPEYEGNLRGDKSNSAVFDNSKIKRFVPGFACTTPFAVGVRASLAWLEAHPELKRIEPRTDARIDTIIAAYHAATRRG
jgi:nucleoside-diphosphate-sugar epimerase